MEEIKDRERIYGLCPIIENMFKRKLITHKEHDLLINHFKSHKMSKLISMTDYVIKKANEDRPCDRGAILQEISDYADFLKQTLTLGMFIPCDENENVLNPKKFTIDNHPIFDGGVLYQEAKQRVIFEEFKIIDQCEDYFQIETEYYNFRITFCNGEINVDNSIDEFIVNTIEDLIEFEITLTETTAKKLGL